MRRRSRARQGRAAATRPAGRAGACAPEPAPRPAVARPVSGRHPARLARRGSTFEDDSPRRPGRSPVARARAKRASGWPANRSLPASPSSPCSRGAPMLEPHRLAGADRPDPGQAL